MTLKIKHHWQLALPETVLTQNSVPNLSLRDNDVAKQPYISFPLSKIAIPIQKHQTQALYTPIRPGQAKFKAQNQ